MAPANGEHYYGAHYVKYDMNERYLHHHIVTHSLYPLCKRKEHRYDNKNNRADYIKENVHNRGTF